MDSPQAAINTMTAHLEPVETECVPLSDAVGRILTQPLTSDRPSPPFDASAMDGYAICTRNLRAGNIRVIGECRAGRQPPVLEPG